MEATDTFCRACGKAGATGNPSGTATPPASPSSQPQGGAPAPPPPGGYVAPPPAYAAPPPGGYAPPPPPAYAAPPPGGYGAPPPGAYAPVPGGYAPIPGGGPPPGVLADWGPRALGSLIDSALVLAVIVPLYVLGVVASVAFVFLGWLAAIAAGLYIAAQVGQTGQSPGMRSVGLKCISQTTGQPIGAGLGIVRNLAHFVDGVICGIGWLFPLWDQQRQTLADKIMSTVVIRVPQQPFSLAPPGP
ncbi:MAG TPA: RDD family protein [Acidimicrobiales bacterium]|nr:RDD family protein [Acidimicrobiales bacterium]